MSYYIIHLLEEPMATKLDNAQSKALFSQTLGQKPLELLVSSKPSFDTYFAYTTSTTALKFTRLASYVFLGIRFW